MVNRDDNKMKIENRNSRDVRKRDDSIVNNNKNENSNNITRMSMNSKGRMGSNNSSMS